MSQSKAACLYFSNHRPLGTKTLIAMNDFNFPFDTKNKFARLVFDENFSRLPFSLVSTLFFENYHDNITISIEKVCLSVFLMRLI